MNKKRVKETFSQSVILLIVSQIIIKILGLIYRLYITNKEGFGDEGNAIFSAGFQIYALMLCFTSIGIPEAISKVVAQKVSIGNNMGAYKILKIGLLIFGCIGTMGSYILFYYAKNISTNFMHMPEAELSITMLAPSIGLTSIISVLKGYFAGRQNLKATAKAQSIDQLSKTIITIVLLEVSVIISKRKNTEIFSACAALGTTLANVLEFTYLYKLFKKNFKEIKEEIDETVNYVPERKIILLKEIIMSAIPIQITGLVLTIARNIDSTSIVTGLQSKLGYEDAKKQYGILSGKVDSLINLPLSFNTSIATALLPYIAAIKNNKQEIQKRINQSLLYGMLIAMPTSIFFMLNANEILKLLFPNASSGASILKTMSITIIFITIEQIANQVLQGIGKTRIPILAIAVGVITKAILNAILVPHIEWNIGGTIGASISTIVCHVIASSIEIISIYKATKIKIEKATIIKPFAATCIFIIAKIILKMILIKIIIKEKIIFIISTIIAGLLYFISLIIMKVIPWKIIKFKI